MTDETETEQTISINGELAQLEFPDGLKIILRSSTTHVLDLVDYALKIQKDLKNGKEKEAPSYT